MREPIGSWRSAVGRSDLSSLLLLAEAGSLRVHLQEAGEALLGVGDGELAGLGAVGERLSLRLTNRAWVGDAELAGLLVAVFGRDGTGRREIRADLAGVADLLEGSLESGAGGVLDCETGFAWPELILDDWPGEDGPPDPELDPDRYLFVPNEGSREAWADMRDFADQMTDQAVRDQLIAALDGEGAFARFKRVLDRQDTVRAGWVVFSGERRAGRARRWLAEAGFDALPARP